MKFNVEIFESNSRVEIKNLYEEGKIKLTDENSHVNVNFRVV